MRKGWTGFVSWRRCLSADGWNSATATTCLPSSFPWIKDPAAMYLYLCEGLRGAVLFDWFDRIWNSARAAIAKSGLSIVLIETTVVTNVFSGPFGGSGWYHLLSKNAKQYSTMFSCQDPLFRSLYEELTLDSMSRPGPSYGTHEHMEETFQAIFRICFTSSSETASPKACLNIISRRPRSVRGCRCSGTQCFNTFFM